MPELPLVERFRTEAEAFLKGHLVTQASAVVDQMMMPDLSPHRFKRIVTGRHVDAVNRRGKYIWLQFDRSPHLVLHFGMTGGFVYNPPNRPSHWRIRLKLDTGGTMYLADARRFGRVLLANEPLLEPPISDLGFDPWLDRISPTHFTYAVRARSAPIKAILLDQSFAAGVGNWIADDVLYLSRISPHRRGHSLSVTECRRVLRQLVSLVRIATKAGSHSEQFPNKWLFHLRWGSHRGITTANGETVRFDTVGTRSTAWVPTVQK
jgi:formamidopyrimidine-DNA glycosylase